MCRPILCAACRTQSVLRRQSYVAYQQRQWLSQSTRKAQDSVNGVFSRPRNDSSQGNGTQAATSDEIPRGRYSGQPLAPQRILDELNEPSAASRRMSPRKGKTNYPQRATREPGAESARDALGLEVDTGLSERSKHKDETESARPSTIPPKLWATYQDFCHASERLEDKPVDHHQALEYLQKIAHQYASTEGLRVLSQLPVFRRRCFFWMVRVCGEWAKELTDGVPNWNRSLRPSQALLAVFGCFAHLSNDCPLTLWHTSIAVAELQSRKSEQNRERILVGTRELMRLWHISMLIRASRTNNSVHNNSTADMDWHFLPDVAMFSENLRRTKRNGGRKRLSFEHTLQMLLPEASYANVVPKEPPSNGPQFYDYPSAALVTLDLLQSLKSDPDGEQVVKEYEPWMNLINTTFKSVGDFRVPFSLARKLETSDEQEVYRGVIRRFNLALVEADTAKQPGHAIPREKDGGGAHKITSSSTSKDSPQATPPLPPGIEEASADTSPVNRFVNTCNKRLSRAREQQNLNAAQSVHADMRAFSSKENGRRLPQDAYEALLYTFLSLRNPSGATSTWSDMIKAGHQPRTKTYTIMMRGSQNVRNQDAMEHFWRQMRSAGLQPDQYAWTTRLFGLLRSPRHIDAGLRAMVEMGHEWITAARNAYLEQHGPKAVKQAKTAPEVRSSDLLAAFDGDVNGIPRPNVIVLNSVMSALAERNDDLIPKALHWGRSFAIEPNITTYNVLINISMRQGLLDEAFKLLKTMKARGLEADSTTWTVLLTALFKGPWLEDIEGEEAAERVLSFAKKIDDMEGQGLDEKGYALLIDRLLKLYNNPSAAQKVLNHMANRGVKPNTHLYTILMASYFEQSPPNFTAIEGLWAQIQSENAGYGAVLDATFYDRMIENYASYHEAVGTKPMLSFLERMETEGKRPSWRALEQIARALVDAGEWERLRHIVEKARREREGGPDDATLFGRKSFWQFIQSTGLGGIASSPSQSRDANPARDRNHVNM